MIINGDGPLGFFACCLCGSTVCFIVISGGPRGFVPCGTNVPRAGRSASACPVPSDSRRRYALSKRSFFPANACGVCFDDIYVDKPPARTPAVLSRFEYHLLTSLRIPLHADKASAGNSASVRPPQFPPLPDGCSTWAGHPAQDHANVGAAPWARRRAAPTPFCASVQHRALLQLLWPWDGAGALATGLIMLFGCQTNASDAPFPLVHSGGACLGLCSKRTHRVTALRGASGRPKVALPLATRNTSDRTAPHAAGSPYTSKRCARCPTSAYHGSRRWAIVADKRRGTRAYTRLQHKFEAREGFHARACSSLCQLPGFAQAPRTFAPVWSAGFQNPRTFPSFSQNR